ncbi:MAG: CPBP family intramembrane glutamic endopeptidase [Candidatus Cybelea sp.]
MSVGILRFRDPAIGVAIAIAVTATLDANGLTAFSALPLLPLMLFFAFLERFSPRVLGFGWGKGGDYLLAAGYPLIVLGLVAGIAIVFGHGNVNAANVPKALITFVSIVVGTLIVGLLTEEGFFRGWLWASLQRRAMSVVATLIATSIAFALWHLSYVTLAKGFTLPPLQVALFIVNAAVIGTIWGLMRARSGSIVVSTVSHSLWNGAAYTAFGEGPKAGVLGLPNSIIFGPEIGIVGLTVNLIFLAILWSRPSGQPSTGAPSRP